MTPRTTGRPARPVLLLLFVLFALAGCAGKIAPYDEPTHRDLRTLGHKVDGLLGAILEQSPTYQQAASAYQGVYVDLRALKRGAEAYRDNALTVDNIDGLARIVKEIEDRHRAGDRLSKAYVEVMRDSLDQAFRLAIQSEVEKRRLR